MANKGLSMRNVREVLRLHHVAGLSGRAIARSLKVPPVTVKRDIRRAEEAGPGWPLPESLDDAALERRRLPGTGSVPGSCGCANGAKRSTASECTICSTKLNMRSEPAGGRRVKHRLRQ